MGEKAKEDEILKLVQLVDQDFNSTSFYFFFSYPNVVVTISFIAFYGLIAYSLVLPSSIYEKIAVAVPFIAFSIALFSFMGRFGEEYLVGVNFKRFGMCVDKDKKPILKALIKMKVKNPDFPLEQIYNMNKSKSMFEKEKLLERLYE